MVNILQSLYSTQDALRVNQAAMSVVSNNIANMNTVGYSKQRLDQESVTFRAGSINGLINMQPGSVAIDKVTRYQDEFLNSFIMQENSSLGFHSKTAEAMQSLDGYFNEIQGTGITGALKDYFAATQTLSTDPMNKVVRANFVSKADDVAKAFNTKYAQLMDYRKSLVGDGVSGTALGNSQLGKLTADINSKIKEITELNRQIAVLTSEQGAQPNSLLDKRQVLLEELSRQAPITTRVEGNSVNLYLGNVQLVSDGKQLAKFKATVSGATTAATVSVVDLETGGNLVADYKAAFPQEQGELKALLDAGGNGTNSILDFVTQLNTLAQKFAKSVNDIQLKQTVNGGGVVTDASLKTNPTTNKLELATENIFLNGVTPAPYDPTTITAANIVVNQVVKTNPYEVATAFAPVRAGVAPEPPIVPVNSDALGNNTNALSFVTMRDDTGVGLGGITVEDYYYSILSTVGNNTSLSKNKYEVQQDSLNQLNDKKQSLVGVNLDEELVDLMKYQKAYEASAQVMSAVNQMMSVIINMGR
ncbi:MAG: flagellar hook-associated protein FlgK [bacterium]